MKKFLPIILLFVGLLVVGGAIFFVTRNRNKDEEAVEDEVALIDVSAENMPVVSLIPREDGHWLDMVITKLGKFDALTLDYEMLYKLPDGRTQGVPGTVRMDTVVDGTIKRELLLGSESSGNFRYDEGVEDGSITLRFRNEKGKLLAKFASEFKLQDGSDELKSVDGSVTFVPTETNTNYFVVMDTVGYPDTIPGDLERDPFGIFSSSAEEVPGEIRMDNLWRWNEAWESVQDYESPDVGAFVQTKSS
ncbi:hypothetical protein ACFL2C_00235 [Patescibacteria group bacterium]